MNKSFNYVSCFTESGPYMPGFAITDISFHSKQSKMQSEVVIL